MKRPSSKGERWRLAGITSQPAKRILFLLLISGFLILSSPLTPAIIDSNNNGLSDPWEKSHNSGNLFSNTFNPAADPDKDGWTNAQEAAAGTNPFDPNPPNGFVRPNITHIPAVYDDPDEDGILDNLVTPEAVTVTWPALAGKLYTLLASPDLTANSWTEIDEPRIGDGTEMGNGIALTQPSGGTAPKMFWRVTSPTRIPTTTA